jgi:hypothetical protein
VHLLKNTSLLKMNVKAEFDRAELGCVYNMCKLVNVINEVLIFGPSFMIG